MGAGADETAESLNQQIEQLRTENVKLRDLLDGLGVELPSTSLEEGGVMGAADTLVALMSEGGSLLREREDLVLEHARLSVAEQAADEQDPDLDRLLEALLEVDALQAEREQLRAERGLPSEEVDDFEDALGRLRPLFSEIDGLRAERQRLATERRGLVEAVEAVGMSAEEILCEEDRDLELQLLNAVKGVAMENESLKADIRELQAQISRLRSSDLREALPVLHQVEKVPRASMPSPVPELHTKGANTLVLDRPSKPEALGAFAAAAVSKESRSGDLEKLQEIIDRLQTENTHLKSHIVALSPQAKNVEEQAFPEEQLHPPVPALPESTKHPWQESAAEAAGDMLPEAPPLLPERHEVTGVAEERAAETAAEAAGDMLPEAPPLLPERHEVTGIAEESKGPSPPEEFKSEARDNMSPEAPPIPDNRIEYGTTEALQTPEVPFENVEEEPQKPQRKVNVRPKQVKKPRPRPEDLLKQAGIPLTPEAMLKQLLSPTKTNKVILPRTELPPEDPDEIALQRQEAMTHLLRVQLGRPRDEGSDLDGRSRELSPSHPKDLDVDATQEQAMKGALHSLFRSFGN